MPTEPSKPDLFAFVAQESVRIPLPILVIGGHAVNAYGYTRTTLDIDFLVCADDFDRWSQVFESFGYTWLGQTAAFAKLVPAPDSDLFPVDVMLVGAETFAKLKAGCVFLSFGSTQLPVPAPLHLIALKLHALQNPERRKLGKDLQDVVQLIAVCEIDVLGSEFQEILLRYADEPTRHQLRLLLGSTERGEA